MNTILKTKLETYLIDFYCAKLCEAIKISSLIEKINACHFSDLSIDTNDCIYQFNCLWIAKKLKLIVIRDVHNEIASNNLGY